MKKLLKSFKVNSIKPTGAGDAFLSALLFKNEEIYLKALNMSSSWRNSSNKSRVVQCNADLSEMKNLF